MIMEVDSRSGHGERPDLFGLFYGTDNGKLIGKLYLHLTEDGHALALGNTEHPDFVGSIPYLIERYDEVTDANLDPDCIDTTVDVTQLKVEL
mmetsp:Transcript_26449/g.72731  ORF Transcript_26449/g.72731 Transcript_26449/m.72731 type:complete len:92 (+) Transcript_26449:1218-1493(+)